MCTVSIFRLECDVLRMACNRDEQRTRPSALAPQVGHFNGHEVMMPTDPVGGGTWIAANSGGVVMSLLNYNAGQGASAPAPLSRGRIIPMCIGADSADRAAEIVADLTPPGQCGPFRLVLADSQTLALVTFDGLNLNVQRWDDTEPAVMFTSSGLGDSLVELPRRALFDEMLQQFGLTARAQDAFHRHHWKGQPHLSVSMRRSDAKTVSHTVVEVCPEQVAMRYHAAAPDEAARDHFTIVPMRGLVAV